MELYILDGVLRRSQVVDRFESMIWTERWRSHGEFELDILSNLENRSRFLLGTYLAINESYRVMRVESVEDYYTDDGRSLMKVQGRSMEAILEDRVARRALSPTLEAEPNWVLTGTPGNIAREMFDHICRPTPALNPNDIIPFMQPGTLLDLGNVPESDSSITWEQEPDTLYNAIRSISIPYDLGFRIVRNFDQSQLYFEVYTGDDRTTAQTVLQPVVFAPNFNSIEETKEFQSDQRLKNVAYVFSELGHRVVYAPNVDPNVSGFDRRILVVRADLDPETPNVQNALLQIGREELTKHRSVSLFDGEVNQRSQFKYGVHYNLGDLVETRNQDGVVTRKRVMEQIFVSDSEGDRSYPTLSMGTFTTPNTWLTWGNDNTVWADLGSDTWSDM